MFENVDINDQLFFTNINEQEEANTVGGVKWIQSDGLMPFGAIPGGYESNGTILYICRASYNGGLHPGKVVSKTCRIGWGGKEVSSPKYEVLINV